LRAFPPKTDLRRQCPAVYDQGELGSCTAFAVGKGLRETRAKQAKEAHVPLSALFLYYETRVRLGGVNKLVDSGGTITDAVAVLKSKGCAPESAWSYDFMQFIRFRVKPPKAAYEQATPWKVKETHQLGFLDDVKTALSQGKTVAFGFEVYESFQNVKSNGIMTMPKADEKIMGGHAVLAVGYDDAKQRLTVRNSWGSGWGDKGYFYMPYEFITPERADDFWTAE
jgi:C1A family cysteine protease